MSPIHTIHYHPTISRTHLLNAVGLALRLRFVVTSLTELLLILWKETLHQVVDGLPHEDPTIWGFP